MSTVLVIGYGNRERCDDGVAYHVVDALRRLQRERAPGDARPGPGECRSGMTAIFVLQLLPELAVTLASHDRVIFVDAHVDPSLGRIDWRPLTPGPAFSPFTHHMFAETLLALCGLYRLQPPLGYLLSVRGHVFDHGRRLSAATAALVTEAAGKIMSFIEGPPGAAPKGAVS